MSLLESNAFRGGISASTGLKFPLQGGDLLQPRFMLAELLDLGGGKILKIREREQQYTTGHTQEERR